MKSHLRIGVTLHVDRQMHVKKIIIWVISRDRKQDF